MFRVLFQIQKIEGKEETAHEFFIEFRFFSVYVPNKKVNGQPPVLGTEPEHIEDIVADGFEVGTLVELVGQWLHFLIRLLEGQEAAEHVHQRSFALSSVGYPHALPYPTHFCCLAQVHVVLEVGAQSPGEHQELTEQVGG